MQEYKDKNVYFGDMHTHCGISYGHGSLAEALANARQQLDFCSVTGHAHWPDMPEPNSRIQYIIDFHKEGFTRLKKNWQEVLAALKEADKEGQFVVFPSFEVHYNSCGDRTVMYKDIDGDIIYTATHDSLCQELRQLKDEGKDSICFPHHLGYRIGARGIAWDDFETDLAPFVEIISMHGCSETNENTRPFLHSMGPSDWKSTVQYGLKQGHIFGFSGNTDHHSAHPGSYGHGVTGVWADDLTRQSLWQALNDRRLYALTGDRINLQFAVNGHPMGSVIKKNQKRRIEFEVIAGGPLDYIDVVKNNRILKRFSECDVEPTQLNEKIRSKLHLELGWGERAKSTKWQVELGISDGRILNVETRFRGHEVVSPVEETSSNADGYFTSQCNSENDKKIVFNTISQGNPNNFTNTTQGLCIEIEAPLDATIEAILNEKKVNIPVRRLVAGARSGNLGLIDSPAYRFNRLALPSEMNWHFSFEDNDTAGDSNFPNDFYYLRVKQKNDQWAWSSPVFLVD
jgi:hypothetical protein